MPSTIAAPFYASGTFWSAAAVVVGLATGIGAMWATFTTSNPRRRLRYETSSIPLVHSAEGLDTDVEVRRGGQIITDPHLVQLVLSNTGRRDIPAAAFDQAAPVRLNAATALMEILVVHSESASAAPPIVTIEGTELSIAPARIGRGQHVVTVALTEGKPSCTLRHALVDVTVHENTPERRRRVAEIRELASTASFAAIVLLTLFIFGR